MEEQTKGARGAPVGQVSNNNLHHTHSGPGPFQLMEKCILDLTVPWGKETFKVNNVLYNKDQAMCVVLENAIWVRRILMTQNDMISSIHQMNNVTIELFMTSAHNF